MEVVQPRPRRIRFRLLSVKVQTLWPPQWLMQPVLASRSLAVALDGASDAPGRASRRSDAPRAQPCGTFEEVYRRWFGTVCGWIRGLGGPGADRDDIAQDVFLVVRRRLADFDGGNLEAWLYRIAQRQVRTFDGAHGSGTSSCLGRWKTSIASRRWAAIGPSPSSKRKPISCFTRSSTSPRGRRMTFILFELEGRSGEEIAEIQRIPLNTVWTRLHHARRDFFRHARKLHGSVVQIDKRHPDATKQREGRS